MHITPLHPWDISLAEAPRLQQELAQRVDVRPPLEHFELVAGADVSYNRFSDIFYACVVVMRPDGTIVEVRGARSVVTFPYVPGLLSFREAPVLLEAFAKVQSEPDVVMIDGQGIAHPRRMGIAAHLGLFLDRPSLGCAKSKLYGQSDDPAPDAGATAPLYDRGGAIIGSVVRTKKNVSPVFVSPGHKIDMASSVKVVLATTRGYRLPEPTRQAHMHVNELRVRGGP